MSSQASTPPSDRDRSREDVQSLLDFVLLYESDGAASGVRPVEEYQRLFPQAAEAVAKEYARLASDLPLSDLIGSDEPKPRIAHYILERELGRGGQGRVYLAVDTRMRRRVALKILNRVTLTPEKLQRFQREVEVIAKLDHPGIAPVHELGLDSDGRVYFTMKLVRGRDLKHIFELVFQGKEGWNETRALSVILKVCEAMAYAHSKRVIHRDLKPANVMIGSFGEVYVMDWGLARVLSREDTHEIPLRPEFESSFGSVKFERREAREESPDSLLVTMDGDVMGTPAYMSPEQAQGELERLSPRSDVYAIGAMLYHLLARHMPFVRPGARMTNRTVLLRVVEGPPKPLHEINPHVPAELVAICEKAMAREPERRYLDTLALGNDLRAYLEHRVVGAYETGAWAETKKWVERNKPLAATLAFGVLALVAGLVVSFSLKRTADANSKLAEKRGTESEQNAALAETRRREAEESESRALISETETKITELETEADGLWPAEPSKLPAYDEWLARARLLVEGRAIDPAQDIEMRFGLADHKAKLAEIRLRARPLTEEEREADRRASANYTEWEQAREERTWIARMLGEEAWPSESEVEAELDKESLPPDAIGLNKLAWPLVDPNPATVVYGGEVKGLVLALRAAATGAERAELRDTLGWALYRTGKLDLALTEERRAVEEASGQLKKELAASLRRMEKSVAGWQGDAARAELSKRRAEIETRLAKLAADLDAHRTYEFEEARDRWGHTQLSRLVSNIEAFADPTTGLYSSGISPEHSWGIARRREFAATVAERSITGSDAKRRWEEAILAISKSEKYSGTEWPSGERLTPQLGLLPIGPDPASGLWEFSHLATGENFEPAERGADGQLVLKEGTGIVLVLIPGGTFTMGAQSAKPGEPNYDPQAQEDEYPPHELTLSPYFLSKYEVTQGQWLRVAGRNPSQYTPAKYFPLWNRAGKKGNLLHPVVNVSWQDCLRYLGQQSLMLPSEAQWEYAARARTSTIYWSGDDGETLRDAGNVADAYARGHGGRSWSKTFEEWDDGNVAHAEVGSYRANAYGLHDVHGNLWECCRDGYGSYSRPHSTGDAERQVMNVLSRVIRGGGFHTVATDARSANRHFIAPDRRADTLGLRPARGITP